MMVFHGIIEKIESEGISFKAHLVQPLCNEQGHLQLHQIAQIPVQPALECFQGGGIYHLCLITLIMKNFLHISSLNLPSFSLKSLVLVL